MVGQASGEEYTGDKAVMPTESDMDKVRSTLKQFVREWAEEGKPEREACFKPLIDEIEARFPIKGMYVEARPTTARAQLCRSSTSAAGIRCAYWCLAVGSAVCLGSWRNEVRWKDTSC